MLYSVIVFEMSTFRSCSLTRGAFYAFAQHIRFVLQVYEDFFILSIET